MRSGSGLKGLFAEGVPCSTLVLGILEARALWKQLKGLFAEGVPCSTLVLGMLEARALWKHVVYPA